MLISSVFQPSRTSLGTLLQLCLSTQIQWTQILIYWKHFKIWSYFFFSRLISWPLLTVPLIRPIWAMNNFKILTNLLPQKHYFLFLKILILSSILSLMDYLLLVIQKSIQCHLLPEALAPSCFNSIHICVSVVKNLPAMQETWIWSLDQEDHDPWRRKWQPTTVLLPGKSHGQRNLAGYSPRGCRVGYDLVTKNNRTTNPIQLVSL